jgi:uncharacterized protein
MTPQPKATILAAIAAVLVAAAGAAQRPPSPGPAIARAAASQVGVTVTYDPSYRRLEFPGGDVPLDRGVCTDVIVRALRAIGVDLQVAVHDDMSRHFADYPQLWGLRGADRNIDHRRVPNLMTFLSRQGKRLAAGAGYQPGDIVAWRLPNGLHHIGILGEPRAPGGHRLVVHNIGRGARLEDVLHAFEELGHYRW